MRRTSVLLVTLACTALLWAALTVRHGSLANGTGATANPSEAVTMLAERLAHAPRSEYPAIITSGLASSTVGIRYASVDLLCQRGGTGAANALHEAMHDSASVVRERALQGLTVVDPSHCVPWLVAGLTDDDSWIRQTSATLFYSMSARNPTAIGKTAIQPLVNAVSDSTEPVPAMAAAALSYMSGHKWRIRSMSTTAQREDAARKWQVWYQRLPAHTAQPPPPNIAVVRSDSAPAFELRTSDGSMITRQAQLGRITVLNFWATWCGPCRNELGALTQLQSAYHPRGVDVVGAAVGEKLSLQGVAGWAHAHRLDYQVGKADDTLLTQFGDISEIPVTVVIDRQGRIRHTFDGPRDLPTLVRCVERLLAEDQ